MIQTYSFSNRFPSVLLALSLFIAVAFGQSSNQFPPPPLEESEYEAWVSKHQTMFPGALKALEKELKANSSNVQLIYQTGVVLMALGDYAKAYKYFYKFSESNTKEDTVLFHMARCSQRQGDHYNAILLYNKFSKLHPADPTPWLEIIDVLLASNDRPQAIQVSEKLAQMFPSSLPAQAKYVSLTNLERPEETIRLYQEISKKWPDTIEPQRTLLNVYLSHKRFAEASTLAQSMVQRFPQSDVAWEGLATLQQRQELWNDALASLNKALPLAKDPRSLADDFMDLGYDCLRARNYAIATQAYQQALQIDPAADEAMYQLGRVYALSGKRKEAEQLQKTLKKKDKDLAKRLEQDIEQPMKFEQEIAAVCSTTSNASDEESPRSLRPKILYQEKARYTDMARNEGIQGIIVVNVVFTADGRITSARIVRGLPYGLNDEAIHAVKKIRFRPACRDGRPVSVRMSVEFTFNLY